MTEQTQQWGERRRRREQERSRSAQEETAGASGASTPDAAEPSVGDAPAGRPLSRRQLRELAERQAQRAQEGPPDSRPQHTGSPAGKGAAVPEPGPSPRPVSRRALREAARTGETAAVEPVEPVEPVVRPGVTPASVGPAPALSPQARAAALREQAARAQQEREEAARRSVERAQRSIQERAAQERAARAGAARPEARPAPAERAAPTPSSPARGPVPGTADDATQAVVPAPRPGRGGSAAPAPAPAPAAGASPSGPDAGRPVRSGAEPHRGEPAVQRRSGPDGGLRYWIPDSSEQLPTSGAPIAVVRPVARTAAPVAGPAPVPPAAAVPPAATAPLGARPSTARPVARPQARPTTGPVARLAAGPVPPAAPTSAPSRTSAPAAPPEATPAPSRTAPPAPSWTTPPARPQDPRPGSQAGATDAAARPRWGAVEDRPLPWAPVPSPTDERSGSGTTGGGVSPSSSDREAPEEEVPDTRAGEHRSPYTWLQVLGLVTVAFVLGVLIYFALVQGSADDGGDAAGRPATSPAPVDVLDRPVPSPFETGA